MITAALFIIGLIVGILIERNNSARIEAAISKALSVKGVIQADAKKVEDTVKADVQAVKDEVKTVEDKAKSLY